MDKSAEPTKKEASIRAFATRMSPHSFFLSPTKFYFHSFPTSPPDTLQLHTITISLNWREVRLLLLANKHSPSSRFYRVPAAVVNLIIDFIAISIGDSSVCELSAGDVEVVAQQTLLDIGQCANALAKTGNIVDAILTLM